VCNRLLNRFDNIVSRAALVSKPIVAFTISCLRNPLSLDNHITGSFS
jgi:hypothetical protein